MESSIGTIASERPVPFRDNNHNVAVQAFLAFHSRILQQRSCLEIKTTISRRMFSQLVQILYQRYSILQHLLNIDYMDSSTEVRNEWNQDQLRDIYHVAFLLRQKLVPDVVPAILHQAGLFERHTCTTGPRTRPIITTQHTAPMMSLVTPPIKSSARLLNPVRKVVFSIDSCDQGWADDPNSGSYTWCTAAVILKGQANDETLDFVRNDRFLTREREIFRNDAASSAMKMHIVEWTVNSENEEESQWVSSLENGDRIAVLAWAQFWGWHNKVKCVSIAVYTGAVI